MNLSKFLRKSFSVILLLTFLTIFIGCSSGFKTIVGMSPENYVKLGPAKGEDSGAFGIFGAALNFIPMGLNSRVESAYDQALKSVPEATALTDVTYQESWTWYWIVTTRDVTITGEAIKEVKK